MLFQMMVGEVGSMATVEPVTMPATSQPLTMVLEQSDWDREKEGRGPPAWR
jgi:hypothetical protein